MSNRIEIKLHKHTIETLFVECNVDQVREQINSKLLWKEILNGAGIRFRERSTGVLYSLCSFHREKTPSVAFWPKSNGFNCHGCGIHGDKLAFICLHYSFGVLRPFEEIEKIFAQCPPSPEEGQLPLPDPF